MSEDAEEENFSELGEVEEGLQDPEKQLALFHLLDKKHKKAQRKEDTKTTVDKTKWLESLTSITKDHPFKAMKTVVELLSGIVVKANDSFNDDNPEWAKMEVQALKEIRMILKDLLPIYEEQTAKFEEREIRWVDKQIDFNVSYIAIEFGREYIRPYVKALGAFKAKLKEEGTIN